MTNTETEEEISILNSKKNVLIDLNYYFNKIDSVLQDIEGLNEKLEVKYLELNNMMDLINRDMDKVQNDLEFCYIEEDIKTLDDLIMVAKKYGSMEPHKKYSVDVKILYKLIEPLEKLKNIVGLNDVKDQLVDQILTSVQSLYDEHLRFHTVIQGPPGVGKTMLAKLIGEIYLNMGILKPKDGKLIFKIARRSDLIGKYLGHTAVQTQEFIDSCDGGVMFIDEVYALGNNEKKDNFSKECIDCINMNLTEKKNFICIIAGYPNEIEKCFFSYNPGLKRRFPFCYQIQGYSPKELTEIFVTKIKQDSWKLSVSNNDLETFINTNKEKFSNYGGDIESLILNTKISHGRRTFGKDPTLKKNITFEDVQEGYKRLLRTKEKDPENKHFHSMYI